MSLGSCSSKDMRDPSVTSQLGEPDHEMLFEALAGCSAPATPPVRMEKQWLAATRLPLFLCLPRVLEKYYVVEPFLKKAFIPKDHYSYGCAKVRRFMTKQDGFPIFCSHWYD